MNDLELLKSELAINGIIINDDGTCQSRITSTGVPESMSCEDKIKKIAIYVVENKKEFKHMWHFFCESLIECDAATSGGSAVTEKMYISAVKKAYRFSKTFGYFKNARSLLLMRLNQDIKKSTESAMSRIVDYHICLNWLYRTIENDLYCVRLLKAWTKEIDRLQNVVAQQMTPSALDLPMKERVWPWAEDDEDFHQREKDIRNQQRYQLPETYDEPDKLEEGFFWREMRNDPYSFWDEESDPYPHYYNYKSKVHRGLE